MEDKIEPPRLKRIASLDFQRGLAVWLMVFLHVFNHIYDYSWVDTSNLFDGSVNFFLMAFLVLLAFLGGWAGYFLLISGTVNALTTTKAVLNGKSPIKQLKKQILSGIGVLVVGFLTEGLGYYGVFGRILRSEEGIFSLESWTNPYYLSPIWRRVFLMEALQIIGWCMIINGIIQFFLLRKGGGEKYLRNIIIYGVLTVIILALTPLVWNFVDNLLWKIPTEEVKIGYDMALDPYHDTWPSELLQSENASFLTYCCVILAGDFYPIFPFITTSFIGSMIGIALANPKPSPKIPKWIALGNLCIFIGVILFILFGDFDINFERPTLGYYLLLLGAQLGAMNLLLWLVEFRGKSQKFGDHIVVKYFRRWGVIALSIFALQIYSLVPRAIFNPLTSLNLLNEPITRNNEGWVFLFAAITVLFYDLLIWLWGKVNFAGSFEWMIGKISIKFAPNRNSRLNFNLILNNVQWIDFKEEN